MIWVGRDPERQKALSVSASLIHDAEGAFDGAVLAYKDITDLMSALKVKDEFVASVSHELRTPLTSIMGFLDLVLEDDVEVPTAVRKNLEVVKRNSERLLGLVSDLLLAAQADQGHIPLTLRVTDVVALLQHSVADLTPSAIQRRIHLETSLDPGVTMYVDPVRLRQVLDNLLSNAIKYTPPEGRVRVSLRQPAERGGRRGRPTPASGSRRRTSRSSSTGSSGPRTPRSGPSRASGSGWRSPTRSSRRTAAASRSPPSSAGAAPSPSTCRSAGVSRAAPARTSPTWPGAAARGSDLPAERAVCHPVSMSTHLVSEQVGQFFIGPDRLEFTEYGSGEEWVVLLHGQLMPRTMMAPLARAMAGAGLHVVTLDLLGHGRSDRPEDPKEYSMTAFAEQVVALLDHLGAARAVVGGTSLGANVSLEVAALAPDRVQGLLLEMPVLDNAVEAGILAFGSLLFVARYAPVAVHATRSDHPAGAPAAGSAVARRAARHPRRSGQARWRPWCTASSSAGSRRRAGSDG